MRYILGFLGVFALGLMLSVGCSDNEGTGGSGGSAGTGGMGGGGSGGNGVACSGNVCPCTEAGIRAAIAKTGGPFTFDCEDPTTLVTEAEIVIDNNVILDGEGNLTVDGDEDHRVFSVPENVTAELRGLSVRRGRASGEVVQDTHGGGILNDGNLTLTHSTVSANRAPEGGGGIRNGGNGTLTLTHSAVSDNTANYGGGISNDGGTLTLTNSTVSGNSGGGISNGGTLTLTNSTVSGNSASYSGGGISNGGTLLMLTNSTVSDNSAAEGGGIYNFFGTLTLTNSTVSGNSADMGGGILNSGIATVTNSTLSRNEAEQAKGIANSKLCDIGGCVPNALAIKNTLIDGDCVTDVDTTAVSNGHNLESPGDTCDFDQATDQVNVSAESLKLGPLANNGGPTQTHALLPGSVALDVIAEAMCEVENDQRGVTRPQGAECDVGAFELEQGGL
jgi:hypothetical protein